MSIRNKFAAFAVLATVAFASAQTTPDRPGVDRPIRVAIFKGIGTNQYWHTSIHTAGTSIRSFLAAPDSSKLGDSLIVPKQGFTFRQFGLDSNQTSQAPSAAQITNFINYLDTADVIIIHAAVGVGAAISNTTQRQRLADFWSTKSMITLHATTDTKNAWAPLDTIQGAQFQNHPNSDRKATLKLDSLPANKSEASYAYLNRGLADTAFVEEWFSFTTSAATIRSKSNLRVTVTIDEASYAGGMGGATVMGDHPMAWYRQLPTGGRTFYSAVGHESQNFTGGTNPRFLRRQIYNAILWGAHYDTNGVVTAVRPGAAIKPSFASSIKVSSNSLVVSPVEAGAHTVTLTTLNGTQIASQSGINQASHTFANLRPNTVYAVTVTTNSGRSTRLVTLQ